MMFSEWMQEVDKQLISIVGVVSADLPDRTWRFLYEDGYMPCQAAVEALEDEGYEANET